MRRWFSVKRDVTTETAAMGWWCRCFAWFVSLFWHFVSRCRSTFVIMTLFSSCIWHVAFWNMRQRMQPASQTKHSTAELPNIILHAIFIWKPKTFGFLTFHVVFGFAPCGGIAYYSMPRQYIWYEWARNDEQTLVLFVISSESWILCLNYNHAHSEHEWRVFHRSMVTKYLNTYTDHIKCHIKNYKTVKNYVRLFCHSHFCHNPFDFVYEFINWIVLFGDFFARFPLPVRLIIIYELKRVASDLEHI